MDWADIPAFIKAKGCRNGSEIWGNPNSLLVNHPSPSRRKGHLRLESGTSFHRYTKDNHADFIIDHNPAPVSDRIMGSPPLNQSAIRNTDNLSCNHYFYLTHRAISNALLEEIGPRYSSNQAAIDYALGFSNYQRLDYISEMANYDYLLPTNRWPPFAIISVPLSLVLYQHLHDYFPTTPCTLSPLLFTCSRSHCSPKPMEESLALMWNNLSLIESEAITIHIDPLILSAPQMLWLPGLP